MNPKVITASARSVALLRRFAQPRAAAEQCELCSVTLAASHRHLLEMAKRQVVCACGPCALRFENVIGGRFKLIPRDARALTGFRMTEAQWESLSLPINLAFLFYDTPHQKMTALYPSPAGATESLLTLTAWEALVAENPALAELEPDVEALLIHRVETRRDYFAAPIDICFELVGLIRLHWRGLSGGETVWQQIDAFFARLREQATPWTPSTPEVQHA